MDLTPEDRQRIDEEEQEGVQSVLTEGTQRKKQITLLVTTVIFITLLITGLFGITSQVDEPKQSSPVMTEEEAQAKADEIMKRCYSSREALKRCDPELILQDDFLAQPTTSDERAAFASFFEEDLLRNGWDTQISVSAPENKTITVTRTLMTRAMAYKLSHNPETLDSLRELGFNTLVFTDGDGHTWAYSL